MVTVFVGKQMAERDVERCFNATGRGLGEGIGRGALVLHRGTGGQDSVDHSHYFIVNEERGGHLPVACVPHVDGSMGRVR